MDLSFVPEPELNQTRVGQSQLPGLQTELRREIGEDCKGLEPILIVGIALSGLEAFDWGNFGI